jgi:hypothetical protein
MRVFDEYEEHRRRFAPTYQAIIASAHIDAEGKPSGAVASLHRVRKQGSLIRSDQHSVWNLRPEEGPWQWSDVSDLFLRELQGQLTPESMKDTNLCLENACYTWYRQTNLVQKVPAWQGAGESVERFAWPVYVRDGLKARLSEPGESAGSLLCIETTEEGRLYRDAQGAVLEVFLPKRQRLYLNPDRDYIAERLEIEALPGPEWPGGADWLKDVPEDKIPRETWLVKRVTEYARTKNGRWYPKIVVDQRGSKTDTGERVQDYGWIYHVYVETPESFPEGTFDPTTLGKEGSEVVGPTPRP